MREKHQQIFSQIEKAQRILVTFPALYNGDAIASSLALALALKKMGKKTDIIATKDGLADHLSTPSSFFSFLPGFNDIRSNPDEKFVISLDTSRAKIKSLRYKAEEKGVKFFITPKEGKFQREDVKTSNSSNDYDLIITLDTPDLESLGEFFEKDNELFYKTPIINIDHHGENEEYGQINLVKLNTVATAEIIYSLLSEKDMSLIDHDVATCLLTGIVVKTKNFKTANINPNTLSLTSALISKDARRDEIVKNLFRSRNLKVLKLWGRILARLSGLKNNKVIWSTINKVDFEKTGTDSTDLSDVIEELIINIPEAEVIMIFYEDPKGEAEASGANLLIHTPKNFDILNLVREYKPKGTDKFMKIETQKALKEIKRDIIELLDKKINQYGP